MRTAPAPVPPANPGTAEKRDAVGGGEGGGGVGAGSGLGAGKGRGGGGPHTALAAYLQGLREQLESVKRYPPLARRRGTHGTVKVSLVINASGYPESVSLALSSGSGLLDDEVLRMVARAAPFAPVPAEIGESKLTVIVPIAFNLDESAAAR